MLLTRAQAVTHADQLALIVLLVQHSSLIVRFDGVVVGQKVAPVADINITSKCVELSYQ